MIIRKLILNDISQLLPLMTQLGYPTSYEKLLVRSKVFSELEGYGIAVACIDEDKIVGWVAWSKSMVLVADKVRFHIEGLIVDENYRGQGIGKKLMQYMEYFAKQYSPAIIDLTSGLRRAKDGTHEFYKSLGYKNEGYMAKLYLRKEV